jgi:iron complex outermembrane receptor protein
VVILHPQATLPEGEMKANVSTEYQTNNGLFAYNLSMAGNQKGFVWNARFSDKMAHSYKNKYDGYVPGSQFRERAGRLMLGVNKSWGHSRLTWTSYHLTPGIVEGERDPETGELICNTDNVKTYSKALPFQELSTTNWYGITR